MPHYIMLQKYTDQGRKQMRSTPARIRQNIQNMAGPGAEVKEVFLTFGEYDIAVVGEFPSDEGLLGVVAKLAEQGNAATTVLRAFTLDEAERAFS